MASTEAYRYNIEIEEWLQERLTHPQVVAMGEMGLDYYWKDSTPEEQDKVFRRQIAIAKEMKLPIVIHNRDATEDCYKILKRRRYSRHRGELCIVIMETWNL